MGEIESVALLLFGGLLFRFVLTLTGKNQAKTYQQTVTFLVLPFIIYVTYDREYYQVDDVRISIDENINCHLLPGREISQYGNNPIVELKTSIKKDRDDLLNAFPFQRTRFSKYCNAFEKV